ncbi:MAG: heavy metal translocating P-type ATPase [Limnochordaceae bacterium]|nr:heavy metal translocating P-type ATPase [Limnochordaceae bacterium]
MAGGQTGTDQDRALRWYRLRGLDCAECAARIEEALQAEGLSEAKVSLATGRIRLAPAHEEQARTLLRRVEPQVQLQTSAAKPPLWASRWITIPGWVNLVAATGLLLTAILVEPRLPPLGRESHVWEYLLYGAAYVLVGAKVVVQAGRRLLRGEFLDETFLMTVATLGAMAIRQMPEAVAVMLFYSAGEYLQSRAVERSRHSVTALLRIRPDLAHRLTTGSTAGQALESALLEPALQPAAEPALPPTSKAATESAMEPAVEDVAPESVRPGDRILIYPGERVPLDGRVVAGQSFLDTSALTGESVPRRAHVGDEILAGMVNTQGLLTVEVTRPFSHSSLARILELVEEAAERKAPTERLITRFSRYYTPIVTGLALAIAILPPLLMPGATWSEWVYRALVLLVISCPCALVLSVPLGYFGGIGGSARQGVLVKGANFLDALADVTTVVFDKTGTLTKGVFEVAEIVPRGRFNSEQLLGAAAAAEKHSSHPIASSIISAYRRHRDQRQHSQTAKANGDAGGEGGGQPAVQGLSEPRAAQEAAAASQATPDLCASTHEEISGYGVRAQVNGDVIVVGSDRLLHREEIPHEHRDLAGTTVHVAVDGEYAGYLTIRDQVREDAADAIRELRRLGVRQVVLLTGDAPDAAERVAREVGVNQFYAQLLPEQKVERLEELKRQQRRGKLAFVGDGINDAPVIARADIGIAMGGLGSDAAIEAADIVIMEDRPSKLPVAIRLARFTHRIVIQNIAFALGVKVAFVALGAVGLANIWMAVFADVGVSLLAVLNSTRPLRFSTPLSGLAGLPPGPGSTPPGRQ